MPDTELRLPVEEKPETLHRAAVGVVNLLRGQVGGQVRLRGFSGNRRNTQGGAVLSSSNYSLDVQSPGGQHAAFVHSSAAATAAPTTANAALLVQDTGASVGGGRSLRLYDAAGVDYVALTSDANGGLVLGGSGSAAGDLAVTNLTVVDDISIGATPATTGVIRLSNNTLVTARNAANSANITILGTDASNNVYVGDDANTATVVFRGATGVSFNVGGAARATISTTLYTFSVPGFVFPSTAGDALTVRNQNSAGGAVLFTTSGGATAFAQNDSRVGVGLNLLFLTDNTYDIGASGATRPRDLFLGRNLSVAGGQIVFPATQVASTNANTLDDYQEATWTPSLGGTTTYTTQSGGYIKIGRMVYIWGVIVVNSLGTGSTNTISGLPESGTDFNDTPLNVSIWTSLAVTPVSLSFRVSGTTLIATGVTAAAASTGTLNIFGNSAAVYFAGCYRTAA